VCDEAVAALDVSTRASVITLLQELQRKTGVGYLFISHDLTLVEAISDDVAVMYLGRIVERGPTASVYRRPAHPYTRALIDAVPVPDPSVQRRKERLKASGEVPSALDVPAGCSFHTRCPFATDICREQEPADREISPGHFTACHHVERIADVLAGERPSPAVTTERTGRP
jgi:oligopeptide/dipeptide ABC transporter ATP-binding protein